MRRNDVHAGWPVVSGELVSARSSAGVRKVISAAHSASASSIAPAVRSRGSTAVMSAPLISDPIKTLSPAPKLIGRHSATRRPGVIENPVRISSESQSHMPFGCSTPLGVPVEPDVNWMLVRSSGLSKPVVAPPLAAPWFVIAARSVTGRLWSAATVRAASRCSASAIMKSARRSCFSSSARIVETRSAGRCGSRATIGCPERNTPRTSATASGDNPTCTTTGFDDPPAHAVIDDAADVARSTSWPYVRLCPAMRMAGRSVKRCAPAMIAVRTE